MTLILEDILGRTISDVPSTTKRLSNDDLNVLSDSGPGIANIVNNVDVLNNQGH